MHVHVHRHIRLQMNEQIHLKAHIRAHIHVHEHLHLHLHKPVRRHEQMTCKYMCMVHRCACIRVYMQTHTRMWMLACMPLSLSLVICKTACFSIPCYTFIQYSIKASAFVSSRRRPWDPVGLRSGFAFFRRRTLVQKVTVSCPAIFHFTTIVAHPPGPECQFDSTTLKEPVTFLTGVVWEPNVWETTHLRTTHL